MWFLIILRVFHFASSRCHPNTLLLRLTELSFIGMSSLDSTGWNIFEIYSLWYHISSKVVWPVSTAKYKSRVCAWETVLFELVTYLISNMKLCLTSRTGIDSRLSKISKDLGLLDWAYQCKIRQVKVGGWNIFLFLFRPTCNFWYPNSRPFYSSVPIDQEMEFSAQLPSISLLISMQCILVS